MSDLVDLFFSICETGNLNDLKTKIQINESLLLEHNNQGETGLTIALINNKYEIVKYLLENGSYKSIFVKGKTNNSLFCTLPLTIKSIHGSKVPPIIRNIDQSIIELIDNSLCDYIKLLGNKKIEEAAEAASKGIVTNNNNNSNGNNTSNNNNTKGQKSPRKSTQSSVPPSPFLAGDLVKLKDLIDIDKTDKTDKKDKKEKIINIPTCLGECGSGRIGLIVNATRKNMKGEAKSGIEPDWIISIAGCLPNSTISSYATSELCYADGSSRGNTPKLSASSNQKFGIGVKVKLKPDKWDSGVLSYTKDDSFVGIVDRLYPGYSDAWYVKVSDPRAGSKNGDESGYYESSLTIVTDSLPIGVGDRVILSEDGYKRDNTWSMSNDSSGTNKVGVVLFIPPIDSIATSSSTTTSTSKNQENRLIYVAPIDDIAPFQYYEEQFYSTFYLYKESWLERAPQVGAEFYQTTESVPSIFSKFFNVGDRVQLNRGTWSPNSIETAGKCLGIPTDYLYGIVRSVGRVADGVQRNVEVYVIKKSSTNSSSTSSSTSSLSLSSMISLYPSYALVPANRFTVLYDTDEEISFFKESLENMIKPTGLNFDLLKGIKTFGIEMWSQLYSSMQCTIGIEELLKHMDTWQRKRLDLFNTNSIWNTLLEIEIGENVELQYKARLELSTFTNNGFIDEDIITPNSNILQNIPDKWNCLACGYRENSTLSVSCISCKAKASAWKCFGCSAVNKLWYTHCIACHGSRERSKNLMKIDKELKKRNEENGNNNSNNNSIITPQVFLPNYFQTLAETVFIQTSGPFDEKIRDLSLSQLSENKIRSLIVLPKRKITDTKKYYFQHKSFIDNIFHDEIIIIWASPFDEISDIKQRITNEYLPQQITNVTFQNNSKVLDDDYSLNQLKSVYEIGTRVLVDYDDEIILKLATIQKISENYEYDLNCDDGLQLEGIFENRLRPIISYTDMSNDIKPTITEDMIVFFNSKGSGSVNRGTIKKICEDGKYHIEILGSSTIEEDIEPDWLYFPRDTLLFNDATLPDTIKCYKTGHAMIISRNREGGYSTGWICDTCRGNGKEHRWLCKGCTSDYCFTCKPHHSFKQSVLVEVLIDGIWRFAKITAVNTNGDIDIKYLNGDTKKSVSISTARLPEFIYFDYSLITDNNNNNNNNINDKLVSNSNPQSSENEKIVGEEEIRSSTSVTNENQIDNQVKSNNTNNNNTNNNDNNNNDNDDLVDAEEDIVPLIPNSNDKSNDKSSSAVDGSSAGAPSIHPALILVDNIEEIINDKKLAIFTEIYKQKQLRLSGNKKKLFRAIRIIQRFKTSLTYDEFTDIDELVNSKDRLLNTALHHAYYIGLNKSADALYRNGASRWILNRDSIPPLAIFEGLATLYSNLSSGEIDSNNKKDSNVKDKWSKNMLQLYKCLRKGNLFPQHVMKAVFRTPETFSPSDNLSDLIDCLINMRTDEALLYAEDAIARYEDSLNKPVSPLLQDAVSYSYRHSYIYKALALLDAGYGVRAATAEYDSYINSFPKDNNSSSIIYEFDPITFYVIYMLWKESGQDSRKSSRLRAAFALSSFRYFPTVASEWLSEDDNVDIKVREEGLIKDDDESDEIEDNDEDDSGSDDDYSGPIDESSPEYQWSIAKSNHGIESKSMDKLMELTGMKEVKLRAVTVCKEVLLAKKRPAHIKATVSMNFLFVGNPGTGKTTVANLLSAAMVELGYRKNSTPIITSANEILAEQDPVQYFIGLVSQGDNGTIFIDEAYNFNPAPAGQTANPSNKVLDHLMLVSETKRETMTFILAGYKDEIQKLLTYNPGFPSRFPKDFTFEFPDYTESQLRTILKTMVKERGMRLQSPKECGVSLSKVAAQRIAKGRGRKGFGNAREVRVRLEACIVQQMDRLGALALHGKQITDRDYATLTRSDVLGDRPNLPTSSAFQELDSMVGLSKVKESLRSLMNLQLQNYDSEMRGEKIQSISLHRVFLGNAGTGKTTVARIYGRLLKDFGFLSDGDLIEVKPSDLIGSAVGESSSKTAAILESAKGKVLFIDEAYGLDPTRSVSYGGQVIDTLVERIDGSAGVDMAVILAGYEPQMRALFKNANNQGFTRRFNLDEAFEFEDFNDNDLRKVLLSLLRRENLRASMSTINLAISLISQRRRLDGFGNAAECSIILDRAKLHLASRKQKAADCKEKRLKMLKDLENGNLSQQQNSGKRGGIKLKNQLSLNIDSGDNNNNNNNSPTHHNESNNINSTSIDENDNSIINSIPSESDCICDPYLLIDADFIKIETSAKNAREAFSDLENMEHVLDLLQDMEDTLNQAKADGLSAAKILEDCHMIFTGPPGTGKTTVAQRFGTMFRQLELLPTDHVEVVTAANLISRYVGNTGPNVVEAMRKAKGGILFVDEAYGMVPRGTGSFGAEAVQAFIDNVTLPEFLGNIIIIFAGYQDDVEQLFGINPGFRSRFDKRRLVFPCWTAEMATRATIKAAERDHGYGISEEGKEVLLDLYRQLAELPDWGSAREVYKVILPAMYSKRARRLAKKQRLETIVSEESGNNNNNNNKNGNKFKLNIPQSKRAQAKAKETKPEIPPYEASDIREAFADPIKNRGGDVWSQSLKDGKLPPRAKPAPSGGSESKGSNSNSNTSNNSNTNNNNNNTNNNNDNDLKENDEENFTPIITTITTVDELRNEIDNANKVHSLLIISFTASWVTEAFELPDFALKYKKVRFSVVNHTDDTRSVFDECGVKEMRVFLIYLNGKMVERVLDKFSLMCLRIGYWVKKQSSELLYGNYEGATLNSGGQTQGAQNHKTTEKVKENVKVKTSDEDGNGNSSDIWAALEEACKELGYSLEVIADFLESGNYPEELLKLIQSKVKANDTNAIIDMLNTQRLSVLAKIKHAIAEIKKKKSATEQAKLDKAKRIGKCPMDYEWIKTDGGYRCAGGSHFVTDAEVNTI